LRPLLYGPRECAGQLSSYSSEGAECTRYIEHVRPKTKRKMLSRGELTWASNVRKSTALLVCHEHAKCRLVCGSSSVWACSAASSGHGWQLSCARQTRENASFYHGIQGALRARSIA
jgi:hypothetical protein